MKKLLLVTGIVLGAFYGYPQSKYELNKDTSKCKNNPLVIINNIDQIYHTQFESMRFIALNTIDSISIYHDKGITGQYQSNPDNGIIKIELKSKIDFINMDGLFDKYHIKDR